LRFSFAQGVEGRHNAGNISGTGERPVLVVPVKKDASPIGVPTVWRSVDFYRAWYFFSSEIYYY